MGPKKKSSKKERAKMTAELMEKLRLEQEQEAARMLELELQRLEEERLAALEKYQEEIVEQHTREEQLENSIASIEEIILHNQHRAEQEKVAQEWNTYVDCGRLPDPSRCDQMNTYLHLWKKTIEDTTMEEASRRTKDVVELLDDLEDLLDTAGPDEDADLIGNWKWIRQEFRDYQNRSIDVASYKSLRNIAKNLNRIDIPSADLNFEDENMKLSLWLKVQLPTPMPNPRRPAKPRLEINFSKLDVQVLLPLSINFENMAIRAVCLRYDHLSDRCETHKTPSAPERLTEDLLRAIRREWWIRQKYMYDNRDERTGDDVEPESVDDEVPPVSYKRLDPSPGEFALRDEASFYEGTRRRFLLEIPSEVLNLRKFAILGGVFQIDLLHQPPQPQDFITIDMNITRLHLPKSLEKVPFRVVYIPPKPTEPGVRKLPEEIEEEMKTIELEMDKLLLITVTWPQHIIFLELPFVCQWDEERKRWDKANIHDLKHNEEKAMLTFRTGLFGTFGLATVRYANLPFQAWEVRPEQDGSVLVQITAAILILEFNVRDGLICLSQLQNSPSNALQDVIGVHMKLHKLKRLMKEAGIDVFPEFDAFCYIENSCEKHWPMEKHLYHDMARLSGCFNFAWSRWNLAAGRRKILLQTREFFPSKSKQKSHLMLLATPLKVSFVECTEVSQMLCEDDAENVKFSADLFNLIKSTCSVTTRKRIPTVSKETIFNLAKLLISIRPISFS